MESGLVDNDKALLTAQRPGNRRQRDNLFAVGKGNSETGEVKAVVLKSC